MCEPKGPGVMMGRIQSTRQLPDVTAFLKQHANTDVTFHAGELLVQSAVGTIEQSNGMRKMVRIN